MILDEFNWSFGLNYLIRREIRSRLKTKSKINLDENVYFQSNETNQTKERMFQRFSQSSVKS